MSIYQIFRAAQGGPIDKEELKKIHAIHSQNPHWVGRTAQDSKDKDQLNVRKTS